VNGVGAMGLGSRAAAGAGGAVKMAVGGGGGGVPGAPPQLCYISIKVG